MKKIYFLLFSLLLVTGKAALSQCTNTTQFPSATININPAGTATTISTCSFAGEFSVIGSAVNGQTLRFTSSVATDFITIHSGTSNGPVVASGVTPLVFANTFTGTLYAHWNTSAACGSQATCRTTTVQCTSCTPPPPPANDLCAGAININCGQTIAGSTTSATIDAVGTCVTALGTAPGVWYTFAGDGSSTTLSLCGSGYDTKIGVFSGSCAGLTCVTGNDDFCGLQSQVTFTANLGTTYYVLVTGFGTNSGAFTLARTCVFPCSGTPTAGTISGPAATVCAGTNITLTLSGYSTGVTGITFQWKSSPTSGGPYTNIAGATNNTYTGPASINRFYICTVTCSNGGGAANSPEFAVNVNAPAHSGVSATPSTMCAPGSIAVTGTVSGGITTAGSGIIVSSGAINLAIPDNIPAGVNTTLVVPAATTFTAATDLKIRINLNHSWSGDLKFTLTSPCGTTFLLDRLGVPPGAAGNADNFGTSNATTPPPAVYILDLAGATVLPETAGGSGFIAAGTYKPSDVNGAAHNWAGLTFPCAGAGTWTLNVSDNAGIDVGTLVDWAIIGPTTGNYTHALTGPGTIVQNPATGPNNSTANFSVTGIPAGTANYTLTSTDVTGCSVSTPISVTVNPTPVVTIIPGGAVTTVSYTGPAVAIPDNTPAGVNIPLSVSGITGNIIDVNFRFDTDPAGTCNATVGNTSSAANHTFIGDLIFRLTSPTATTVNVMNRRGGTRENICATLLDDDGGFPALSTVTSVTGQFLSGNFAPDNVLSAFDGVSPNGTWNLNVSDNAGIDVGSMRRFSLIISTASPTTICAGQILQLTSSVSPAGLVVFTPATDLYTDNLATIPYIAGTPVTTVWAKPTVTRTYTATNTSGAGCVGSSNITITVNQLPAITTQPTALAAPVCPGFNVTYTVGATGTGLTYQWQLSTDNGTTYNNLLNNATYSGVTTANLVITNVATSMTNYRYRCIVSGTCPPAVTSNAVTLVVATAPTITTQPANVTICANANASFSVVATGIPAPTIYQWQVSTDGGATWTNLTTGGSFTPTFTITGATTAQNNTRYRVIVTNSCGQNVTSSVAVLTVNALPVVTATALASRICISDTLIGLSGLPVGGSWSGIGVSGFNFVPTSTAVGTYTLTYTYTNAAGCTASAPVVAKVEDCQERIRLLEDNAVILYPNPNNGQFNIRINSTLYNYLGMKVYNAQGQLLTGAIVNDVMTSQVFSGLVYGRVIPINLTKLPAGIYLVKFFYDDGNRTSEKGFKVVIAGH